MSEELAATIELNDRKSAEDGHESEPPIETKPDQLQVPSASVEASQTTQSQTNPPKRLRVLRVRRLKSLVDSYDNLGEHRMSDPFRDDESDYLETLDVTIPFSGIAQDLDRRRKKSKLLCEALVFIPFYFLFIMMLTVNRDVNKSYLLENAIEYRLLYNSITARDGNSITFEDITTLTYLWDWVIDGFIPIVFRDDWYNGDDLDKSLWHTVGYQTRLVGGFRLEQKRGKKEKGILCYDSPFDNLAPTCQSDQKSKKDIECNGRNNCTYVKQNPAFQYRCDDYDFCGFYEEFSFFTFQSNTTTEVDLITVNLAQYQAEQLRINRWIDEQTRSISVKANFYNNNYKTWVILDLKFDCSLAGQVLAIDSNHYSLRMDLFNGESSGDVAMIILGVVYILFVIGFTIYIIYRYYYHKKNDVEMIIDEDEEYYDQINDSNGNITSTNYGPNLANHKSSEVSATETAQSGHSPQTQQSGNNNDRVQFENSQDRHQNQHQPSRLKVKRVRKVNYFNRWDWFKRSALPILLIITNLCVIISFLVYAFDETRINCVEWKKSSSNIDFDAYVPLNNLIRIDDTFRSFVVVTLVLLTLSSVRYFQITNSGEAVFMALVNALPIIVSYLPIYCLTLFGFAVAGHWLFGMELETFSTVSLAFFSIVQINFGLLDVQTMWDISWVGNIYILIVLLVFIPFLLNIFLAITINSWDDFLAFKKQLKNPLNVGISAIPSWQTVAAIWYRIPLVQIREELLKLLLEDKLDYNQVKSSQLRTICYELGMNEEKTKLLLTWFWKVDTSTMH